MIKLIVIGEIHEQLAGLQQIQRLIEGTPQGTTIRFLIELPPEEFEKLRRSASVQAIPESEESQHGNPRDSSVLAGSSIIGPISNKRREELKNLYRLCLSRDIPIIPIDMPGCEAKREGERRLSDLQSRPDLDIHEIQTWNFAIESYEGGERGPLYEKLRSYRSQYMRARILEIISETAETEQEITIVVLMGKDHVQDMFPSHDSSQPIILNGKAIIVDQFSYDHHEHQSEWYWFVTPHISPVIEEVPRAFQREPYGCPITYYNKWPSRLRNASIFPYLLSDVDYSSLENITGYPNKPNFKEFVQEWYQCTCAILECRRGEESEAIIGTGCCVGKNRVVTSRHIFEHIPPDSLLYIRFFKYTVTIASHGGCLCIQEDHIDVPILKRQVVSSELDAVYLELPDLSDEIVTKYIKILPEHNDSLDRISGELLPIGSYAMFHFADGEFQVSIGKVTSSGFSMGMKLYCDIDIQAGSGASGAPLIQRDPAAGTISGYGISVFRKRTGDELDRRVIPFAQLHNPKIGIADVIIAPYRNGQDFLFVSAPDPDESSYEYRQYRSERDGGQREEKPRSEEYRVKERFSNHHIIPIADLIFLWEYFHHPVINDYGAIHKQAHANRGKRGSRRSLQIETRVLLEEEARKQYGQFLKFLERLCPRSMITRQGFAWSYWNIFQGWGDGFRQGDPKYDDVHDLSEKQKPLKFDEIIWKLLKDPGTGLYACIQRLKRKHRPMDGEVLDPLLKILTLLAARWDEIVKHGSQIIHLYNEAEWEEVGNSGGHPIYRLRCFINPEQRPHASTSDPFSSSNPNREVPWKGKKPEREHVSGKSDTSSPPQPAPSATLTSPIQFWACCSDPSCGGWRSIGYETHEAAEQGLKQSEHREHKGGRVTPTPH